MFGVVGLLRRYRKEGVAWNSGCVCVCTWAAHSCVAVMENFTSVCVGGQGQNQKEQG